MHTSISVSWPGECREVARTLCAGFSLFCLLQPSCCTLLWGYEAPFLPSWSPKQWSVFPGWGNLSSFTAPFQECRSCPSSFFFSFILPGYMMIFLAILFVRDLPAFNRYCVRIVPHVDVFLMYLWEEMSSMSFYSTILIALLWVLNRMFLQCFIYRTNLGIRISAFKCLLCYSQAMDMAVVI